MSIRNEGFSSESEAGRETQKGGVKKILKRAGALLAIGLSGALAGCEGRATISDERPVSPPADSESIGFSFDPADRIKSSLGEKMTDNVPTSVSGPIEIYPTFFSPDENGEQRFNWLSIGLPVQIEGFRETTERDTLYIEMPNEFARDFKNYELLDPEDKRKAAEYMADQIRIQLANEYHGLRWSKEISDARHQGQAGSPEALPEGRVTALRVKGTSSPEARFKGGESLLSGQIEDENLQLAENRARTGIKLTLDELIDLGIDTSQIEGAIDITAEEIQFTDQELSILVGLAGAKDGDPYEAVMQLINDYNDGKIKDPDTISQLDQIVGSKRMVQIEVEIEKKGKTRWFLPLPLLAILLFRRRKHELPPEVTDPRKLTSLKDDIYIYFDDPDCKRRGLDYRAITDQARQEEDKYDTVEEQVDLITKQILTKWREHDIEARREAGVQDLETGLDYENNSEQVAWAKSHAEMIMDLVNEKVAIADRGSKDKDYLIIMDEILKQSGVTEEEIAELRRRRKF
jgi:hypothetical protein